MASKYFYHNVIIRVLLIVLSSLLLWVIIDDWQFIVIILALLIAQIVSLIYFLNHTNRKIAFFFEAIKNDDSTLYFPLITKSKTVKELNHSLNEVNDLVKNIRLEVQAQEQYYQMLLEEAETGILSIDEKGHIHFSNHAAKKYLQVNTLTHINQFQNIDKGLWQVLKNMRPGQKKHLKFQTEKDSYEISLKSSQLTIKDQKILLVVMQDIRSEMEDNESESWIRLIRVLTHEIMNSVTPITSLSESLTYYLSDKEADSKPTMSSEKKLEKAISGLNVIKEQSQSLLHFVESYRQLTRLPKLEIKTFSGSDFLSTIRILSQSCLNPQEVNLITAIDPPGHMIVGDQEQLTQVLLNIVKNAYESVDTLKESCIEIRIAATEHGTQILVEDNGPGIPPENINEVFTPFFTTKDTGTGVGLSLSKQIVRNHGGTITVQSQPGVKTRFTILLN